MISDTILLYVVIILLINCFGSKLIPQLTLFGLEVYVIYTKVLTSFEPIDVILISITILYSLGHIIDSFDPENKEMET